MIKPQVEIIKLEMEDPVFEAGETKLAHAQMTNPTAAGFTYTTELYLGINKVATSGQGPVTIPAGGTVTVEYPVTMPLVEGSFKVYLEVRHNGNLLQMYEATEDVVVQISPAIIVGPITWA